MVIQLIEDLFYYVVDSYEDQTLSKNKHELFSNMMQLRLDFKTNINKMKINQNNKIRSVLSAEPKSLEEITLKYLKHRIDYEFNIKYPNRNTIVNEFFNLTNVLKKLDNFTIYKIDFKDFFKSVSSKSVFDEYISNSNLLRIEQNILIDLIDNFSQCEEGIPTSNALIEIISREFDKKIKQELKNLGLIFYSRYVDDILIVLNKKVNGGHLDTLIKNIIEEIYNKSANEEKVIINDEKTKYINKDSNENFNYLGYEFDWLGDKFQYGVSKKKIDKNISILKKICKMYKRDQNIELFRQRILFFASRAVFYTNINSKYSNKGQWNVLGFIENYKELRPYCNRVNDKFLTKKTNTFLKTGIINSVSKEIDTIPYFLKSTPSYYQLKCRMMRNKSIVFHPNIGWKTQYLIDRLKRIDGSINTNNKSYRELVKIYFNIINGKGLDNIT